MSGNREGISGQLRLELPWPLTGVSLGSWGPTGDETGRDDTYRWSGSGVAGEDVAELPSLDLVPRGMVFRVSGEHHEPGVDCRGHVDLVLDGGFTDSPVGPVSLGLTPLSGVGLVVAGRPKVP